MKCNDFENSKPQNMSIDKTLHNLDRLRAITEARREYYRETNLDDLDKALHSLDMLSVINEARREYLRENKSNYSVMRFNTRYVSNVTVGYCMKRTTNKNRLCPYVLPIRHRTKSENSETIGGEVSSDGASEYKVKSLLEPSTSGYFRENTKRCQSLENLNLSVDPPSGAETSTEMDCVSTQIQKLHVNE